MMHWKVCGMRDPGNIREVASLLPDMMGFIFYPPSKRFVGEDWPVNTLDPLPSEIKKVGVFVNAHLEEMLHAANRYRLSYLQLHGQENRETAQQVKDRGFGVIKVFAIDHAIDQDKMEPFVGIADFLLFDTKTPQHGGSGKQFNWELLKSYHLPIPFLLSGGISLDDVATISDLDLPKMWGIDVNSRFEQAPGLKNFELLKSLSEQIRTINQTLHESGN